MRAFREFKAIWDPAGPDEPGQGRRRRTSSTRTCASAAAVPPASPHTHFRFPEDDGRILPRGAALRRRGASAGGSTGGTMCPSFMVTREEKHSTRGRARLLFEMLDGRRAHAAAGATRTVQGGARPLPGLQGLQAATARRTWTWPPTRPSSCRTTTPAGCARAPPTRWASSTGGRGWPRRRPASSNALTQHERTARIVKAAAGIAPERRLPRFARRPRSGRGSRRRARAGRARDRAVRPLARHVQRPLPSRRRPGPRWRSLEARRLRVDDPARARSAAAGRSTTAACSTLRAAAARGPSWTRCGRRSRRGRRSSASSRAALAVFRDELLNLFPDDPTRARLARAVVTLGEFLERTRRGWRCRAWPREALVQAHCHQKAVMGMDAERRVLARAGLDYEILDSGCCGMAGAFGFEAEHYDLSHAGRRARAAARGARGGRRTC